MDEHFADLFARYQALAPHPATKPAARPEVALTEPAAELTLARSAVARS
jgi:hypothetical protein